jgi:dTDP-4-dehydrorhamnose 3,5-epimerase
MKLKKTRIEDLFLLHRPVRCDERGFFSRLFGSDEMTLAGRPTEAVHVNSSTSTHAGTLRGLHFQYPPYMETKIVSCASGAIWDVGVDLRLGSSTRFQWFGTLLTPENGISMVIPEGFGHGFITLEPNSTAIYVTSAIYSPRHESGIRYDDPRLNIHWPSRPQVLSDKDQEWGPISKRINEIDAGFKNGFRKIQ